MRYSEAVALVKRYGVEFLEGVVTRSVEEAVKVAEYPVAIKIVSEEITHKTDRGCVKLNIKDEGSLRKNYEEVLRNAGGAKIEGVLVQRMAKPGVELIVGGRRDEQFGAVVLFGLGGVFVEVFRDFSLRVCPIDREDALEMMKEVKAYPILAGARGAKYDVEALADLLQKVSKLLYENKQINEMDLNPVIVYEKGYCAVDVRVMP
ncbi:MAG: acetate--CoA ligase family protein [Candidatus Micrarchaeia archaeon]